MYEIQTNCRRVVIYFIEMIIDHTGRRDIVPAGGVALNSRFQCLMDDYVSVTSRCVTIYPGNYGKAIRLLWAYHAASNR